MKRILLAAMLCATALLAQNIVKNSGFDNEDVNSAKLPDGWIGQGQPAWQYTNTDGASNASAVKLTLDAAPNDANSAATLTQVVKCLPNTDYTLRAMLKGDGSLPVVAVKTAAGEVLAEVATDSKIWKEQSAKFRTAQDAAELTVVISCKPDSRKGTATVDDVMVFAGAAPAAAKVKIAPFVPKGENIAFKKPYTFSRQASYSHCKDPGDKTQLTDGVYTKGYFWTQKSTVGWNGGNNVSITIDLGKTFPISGFSFSTAFGTAGVKMPEFIHVYASEDNKEWYYIGELMAKSIAERGLPSETEYTHYKAATNDMPCKGRFICFLVKQRRYTFCDELEVIKGDDSLLAKAPSEEKSSTPMLHFYDRQLQDLVLEDIQKLEKRIGTLTPAEKTKLSAEIADYRKNKLKRLSIGSEDVTPIIPLDNVHADLYAINAKFLRAKGLDKQMLWRSCRWDNLNPLDAPTHKAAPAPLEVEMMRGEVRAESFNILNPTDKALKFKIEVKGLPEGSGIDCREVMVMVAKQMKLSSSALRPGDGDSLTVDVPSGMSRQIWLSFNRPTLKAGLYKATVSAVAENVSLSVPLSLRIYDLDFPKQPRLHVGGWDYLDGDGNFYKGKDCIEQNIAMMRSIYADSPWARAGVLPKGAKFDKDGHLLNADQLDFSSWEKWTARWTGARIYCVFVSVKRKFNNEQMGTPRFNRMVSEYYSASAKGLKSRGIDPKNVVLLLVDETMTREQDERIIAWAKPIHDSKAGFLIYEDPRWKNLVNGDPEMYNSADILCPSTVQMTNADDVEAFIKFFTDYRDKGKTLWLYACKGPARLLDPITYHRGQEWRAFEIGAEGSFYWALGCGGGIGDSWHPFRQPGTEFSPFMVSPNGPMDAKQSEGLREGVQDYEYLCMLRDSIAELKAKGVKSETLAKAEKLLAEAPARALRLTPVSGAPDWSQKCAIMWYDEKDRTHMDTESRNVLRMLDELRGL